MARTIKAFGRLDVVVNNAGWTHRNKPLLEVTEEEFDRIYAINVKAIYLMTRATTPILRDGGGGSVINIGSTAGVRPRPGLTWYNGSKGFVNLVSKSMAVELAPMNIRVNCIAPVLGQTGLTEDFIGGPMTPERLAKLPRDHPARTHVAAPPTSRRPASIWPATRPSSSPAWCCRWTAGGRFDIRPRGRGSRISRTLAVSAAALFLNTFSFGVPR